MSNLYKQILSRPSEKEKIIAGTGTVQRKRSRQWWLRLKKTTDWRGLKALCASVSPGSSVRPSRHLWRWLRLKVRWALFTVREVCGKALCSSTNMRDFEDFGKETSPLVCGCSLTPQSTSQHTKSKSGSPWSGCFVAHCVDCCCFRLGLFVIAA